MARNQHDHFYRLARKEGYRSRAAYKLKQINSKFHVIRRGDSVVDPRSAPGGWLRMAKELSGGGGDITAEDTVDRIRELIGSADIVLCDATLELPRTLR